MWRGLRLFSESEHGLHWMRKLRAEAGQFGGALRRSLVQRSREHQGVVDVLSLEVFSALWDGQPGPVGGVSAQGRGWAQWS